MRNTAFVGLFILFLGCFMSCNQTDPNEKGRLVVNVTYNGENVANAITAIATSKKNLNAGIHVSEVHTDLEGNADFGPLLPGTYYCDSYKYIDNNTVYLYGSTVLTVEPGHRKTVSLTIVEK